MRKDQSKRPHFCLIKLIWGLLFSNIIKTELILSCFETIGVV